MQNMPDVLAEHQSIMLENFEAIYISINGTVPVTSQSFIVASAILCVQVLCQMTGCYGIHH